jgi:hypothetical protein
MWARFTAWLCRQLELAASVFMLVCLVAAIVLLVSFPALLHNDWRCIFVRCALVTP